MTADHWETKENAEFLRQLGFYRGLMRLNSGDAVLKGVTFSDGTIEFDVNTIGRGAPGIAFRQQDEGNFELLYLWPDPSCPAFIRSAFVSASPEFSDGFIILSGVRLFRTAMETLSISSRQFDSSHPHGSLPDGYTEVIVGPDLKGVARSECSQLSPE